MRRAKLARYGWRPLSGLPFGFGRAPINEKSPLPDFTGKRANRLIYGTGRKPSQVMRRASMAAVAVAVAQKPARQRNPCQWPPQGVQNDCPN